MYDVHDIAIKNNSHAIQRTQIKTAKQILCHLRGASSIFQRLAATNFLSHGTCWKQFYANVCGQTLQNISAFCLLVVARRALLAVRAVVHGIVLSGRAFSACCGSGIRHIRVAAAWVAVAVARQQARWVGIELAGRALLLRGAERLAGRVLVLTCGALAANGGVGTAGLVVRWTDAAVSVGGGRRISRPLGILPRKPDAVSNVLSATLLYLPATLLYLPAGEAAHIWESGTDECRPVGQPWQAP